MQQQSFESSWALDNPPPTLYFAEGDTYVVLALDLPWAYEFSNPDGSVSTRYVCNVVTPELLQSKATSCRILQINPATKDLFRADPMTHWTRITRLPAEARKWLCIVDTVRKATPDDIRRAQSMMPWNLKEAAEQYVQRAAGGRQVALEAGQ
jgi:hypothetical protein